MEELYRWGIKGAADARQKMQTLVKADVDPMEALRAATYWPAVQLKVDHEVGTVSEGKYADIIAVRGDVLRHIGLLQRVDVVVKRGRRYK